MINEDDYLAISGLQHFSYCRRQWALIHIEKQWADNFLTVDGQMMHKKAHDDSSKELRGDVLTVRGLSISSESLGITGKCDVVEFHRDETGISLQGRDGLWKVYPIEYKRGMPKANRCDEAQLYAEAMCLEEMLCTSIQEGAIFYGEVRRREVVCFDADLRQLVKASFNEMRRIYENGYTPKAKFGKQCRDCSLNQICLPELLDQRSVDVYLEETLCEDF